MEPVPGKGKAVASLVLGIISVVFAWFGYFAIISIILSIIGIALGVSAKKDMEAAGVYTARGMATAGFVLSLIALVLSAVVFVSCTLCISCAICSAA